jgi:hypothetical protein
MEHLMRRNTTDIRTGATLSYLILALAVIGGAIACSGEVTTGGGAPGSTSAPGTSAPGTSAPDTAVPSTPGTSAPLQIRLADGRVVQDGDIVGRYNKMADGGCDYDNAKMLGIAQKSDGTPADMSVLISFDASCVATAHVRDSGRIDSVAPQE